MLDACRKEGVTLAVASSKPQLFVHQVLEHFDIEKYFSVIVGSEMDGRRTDKKEVVDEALRQLTELAREKDDAKAPARVCAIRESMALQTAMVGDRCYDMEGAAEHHLKAVGVSYGYGSEEELRDSGAHMVAGTVAELQQMLLK